MTPGAAHVIERLGEALKLCEQTIAQKDAQIADLTEQLARAVKPE